ncbi:MAG: hypothetical protein ACRC3B_14385, partial [Bacteroidia bacterium]
HDKQLLMRIILLLAFLLSVNILFAGHELVVRIAHGSKPHPQHRDTEKHWLGGMYGGHVVIELDSFAYGFNFRSQRVHIFPRKNESRRKGVFEKDDAAALMYGWKNLTVTSVVVPHNDSDYKALRETLENLHTHPNFDYAFFGMRCASTAYMLLSKVGVFAPAGKLKSMRNAFHPKALRKRLIKSAQKNNYRIAVQQGSAHRIWEGDKHK